MKTKKEIEKLAFLKYPRVINDPYNPMEDDNSYERKIWIGAYTQCAEDMTDKKYTEEDLLHAFREGVLLPNSQIGIMEDIFKQVVQSLNKYYADEDDDFKKGDEVWVKDLENEFPVSAIFIRYNDFKNNNFKYRVVKRGNNYESDVNFCKLKQTRQ